MSASANPKVSITEGSTGSAPVQPSETSTSYFPKNATALTYISASSAVITPRTSLSSNSSNYPLSPMDREYTKPQQDLDIAQQLSQPPTYWSVQGWIQRTANSRARPAVEDAEAKTRRFEETKRDLLASVGRFD
ncbi:hypothetical protein F4859DRAFT_63785 [Xylaria cf. heliscus]|nr:hypothetical protein F4859DRAFT_63785 [Xylaria cf. heliscus]